MGTTFYLSGVMQGSLKDNSRVSQEYRQILKDLILRSYPDAKILCPAELFPDAPTQDEVLAKSIVPQCAEIASSTDVLVAFLPEASMGTAVELWEAYKSSRINIVISPMRHNLMLKAVSDVIVPSIEEFGKFISDGNFTKLLAEKSRRET